MPGQIIHLAVAREISEGLAIADLPQFYLGALAPDAIHAFSDAPRPRKVQSHLLAADADMHNRDNSDTRENVRRFLAEKSLFGKDRPFYLGYAAHILTDICWLESIYRRFISHPDISGLPQADSNKQYYWDMEAIQYGMYQSGGWIALTWDLLKKARPVDLSPIVTSAEIEKWKERTLHWYDGRRDAAAESPRYMKAEEIEAFIKAAGKTVGESLLSIEQE